MTVCSEHGLRPRAGWRKVGSLAVRFLAGLLVVSACLLILADIARYPLTSDLPAFLTGARRLASGVSPYGAITGSSHEFVYGPWLAAAFIPATWIPEAVLAPAWHAVLAIASAVAVWPFLAARRFDGFLAAGLLATFLAHAVWAGHFQPIMIAILGLGLPTRWGPVAVGVAASMKVTPIVLCVRWAGRGEWRKVAVATAVAAVLWAPALLLDLRGWGLPVLQTHSLLGYAPIAWVAAIVVAAAAAWRLAATRYAWLAAAALWLAVLPRMILYDMSGVAVASADLRNQETAAR